MITATCFHCGAPLHDATAHQLQVDGRSASFCGPECAGIARQICADGLTEFYRFRTGPFAHPDAPGSAPGRWSGYDRLALQRQFVVRQRDGSREAQLLIHGVRCAACGWLIEQALGRIAGVRELAVDPLTTRARLRWDPAIVPLSELLRRIAALGYDPAPFTIDATEDAAARERKAALRRLIVAGLGMSETMSYATAMYAGALADMDADIQYFLRVVSLLVATPVVFYSGAPFFRGAWRGLVNRRPGMDLPVAIAIAAAYAASVWAALSHSGEVYFDSAVMFVFFLSAARFLEMSGRHRALGLTGALAQHLPTVATRLADGRSETVGVVELMPDDRVLVQPGQNFPVDGILESDAARVDESLLTGESRPVRRQRGDRVLAGSINLLQSAIVRVERIGTDTLLAQIGRLVTAAREERPRLVQIADRVGAWFVTGLLVVAAAVGFAWWMVEPERAFEVVLAVLVVTCPCALALATPAAFAVGTGVLARRGFLLRRAGAIEALSRITDMLFDKTGTLTEHVSGIQRIEVLGAGSAAEMLALAAGLEAHSEHPIARAFPRNETLPEVADVRAVPGAGIEGRVDGRLFRIGTREFAAGLQESAAVPAGAPAAVAQSVYLGGAQGLMARFEIAERIRPGTLAAMRALRNLGVGIAIASGDQPGPVRAVARQLSVEVFHSEMRPESKLELVRSMQRDGRVVAMIGDGINDSPVLAGADVSVAMGNGATLAQHSADCMLIGTDPLALAEAVRVSRRTMRVVRQNLAWALAYNIIGVPLAAFGLLAPWVAAIGMSASSLLVTFNALRLSRLAPAPPAGVAREIATEAGNAATP
jgi:Cu2+-exporting ATPase